LLDQSHKEILLESDKLTLVGLKQYKCELTEKEKNRKLVDILENLKSLSGVTMLVLEFNFDLSDLRITFFD
jgi:hypothetical protein